MILQYTIVAIIILIALLVALRSLFKKKDSCSSCCGCALADSCKSKDKNNHPK